MQRILYFGLVFTILATTAIFPAEIIDNFHGAKVKGKVILSKGRKWYSFGGVATGVSGGLLFAGKPVKWAGIGFDSGKLSANGPAISIGDHTQLVLELRGRAGKIKVELFDADNKKYEHWLKPSNSIHTISLHKNLQKGIIKKMQIMCPPGEVDLTLWKISLK